MNLWIKNHSYGKFYSVSECGFCKEARRRAVFKSNHIPKNNSSTTLLPHEPQEQEILGAFDLSTRTQPDFPQAVGYPCDFSSGLTSEHWNALKLLKYWKGTTLYSIAIRMEQVEPYINAPNDPAPAVDTNVRRSSTIYLSNVGSSSVDWGSAWRRCVDFFTMEAAYCRFVKLRRELFGFIPY